MVIGIVGIFGRLLARGGRGRVGFGRGGRGRVGFGRGGRGRIGFGRGGRGRVSFGSGGRGRGRVGFGRVGMLGRGGNVGRLGNWESWRADIPTSMLENETTAIRAKKKNNDFEGAMLLSLLLS
ncbi:hypothetical protein LINPERHAP1_LOCUS7211 [Linum perenne]